MKPNGIMRLIHTSRVWCVANERNIGLQAFIYSLENQIAKGNSIELNIALITKYVKWKECMARKRELKTSEMNRITTHVYRYITCLLYWEYRHTS